MKTIGLIPLDSRPCNTLWLEQFCGISKFILLEYPRHKCGDLSLGADFKDQMQWIKSNIHQMDYLIISCDGLVSGGLIQARKGLINIDYVINELKWFEKIKETYPNLKIYMFDTLMRTSISTLSNETMKYWKLMNEYSRLVGHIYFFQKEEDKIRLEELKKQIPESIITEYLNARKKKNILNKLFIQYTVDHIIDYLILLQEDSMPYGIQKIEQLEIEKIIKNIDNINMYNGTDEGGVILLAKAVGEIENIQPQIFLHLPKKDCLNKVMLFEDELFINNLNKMMKTLNMNYSTLNDNDFILSIYCEDENIDLELDNTKPIIPTKNEEYYSYIKELNKYINNQSVCFIDLLFPNGGSIDIINDIDYRKLSIYSAWNTASNSLGSALAQIVMVLVAKKNQYSLTESNKFTKERILDDCIYQYIVRRKINEYLINKDINIFDLKDKSEYSQSIIEKEMNKIALNYFDEKYQITLPWKRTFECEIRLREVTL